jgi:lipid-A-disaccharide synthase-like uncharacterized protein
MSKTGPIIRSISSLVLGMIATLILFGLVLTLLWTVIPQEPAWKLYSALASAALALFAGGFVVAWLSNVETRVLPAAFGLFFGGASFTYLLGPEWIVLAFATVSALAAALGALVFRRVALILRPEEAVQSPSLRS